MEIVLLSFVLLGGGNIVVVAVAVLFVLIFPVCVVLSIQDAQKKRILLEVAEVVREVNERVLEKLCREAADVIDSIPDVESEEEEFHSIL